ncbi:MAG: cyclic nucleotide-binding domain-containing protein [Actinomycetota bacterium]
MKKDAYLERLAEVPMFQALSKKELIAISRLVETLDVEEGRVLAKEGATGHEFFVIAQGTATVSRGNRKVATLGAGDAFGELSLLEHQPRNATVTAATSMKVLVLGQREFLSAIETSPGLSLKLLKGMARRLREADARPVQ